MASGGGLDLLRDATLVVIRIDKQGHSEQQQHDASDDPGEEKSQNF